MEKIHNWINTILVGVLFIVVLVGNNQSTPTPEIPFSGVSNLDALTLDDGDLTITNGGITFSETGNVLAIPSANTATSTVSVGCIQSHATSTASPIRFVLGRFPNASSTYNGATLSNGFVFWQFGSCPV